MTDSVEPAASLKFKNTGTVALMVCNAANANDPCTNGILVNPGGETQGQGTELDPLKPFVNVMNNDPSIKGKYELTVDNG